MQLLKTLAPPSHPAFPPPLPLLSPFSTILFLDFSLLICIFILVLAFFLDLGGETAITNTDLENWPQKRKRKSDKPSPKKWCTARFWDKSGMYVQVIFVKEIRGIGIEP